jgi:hypothetical protein
MLDDKSIEEIFEQINEFAVAPPEVIDGLIVPGGRDEITGPVLEIRSGDRWFAVTKSLWDSWTGLRRMNGTDHHGPVVYIDSPVSGAVAYRGKRTCGCRTCEESVPPSLRKN